MRAVSTAAIAAALCIAMCGCERVVDITVVNSVEQLVVEGRVEAVQGHSSGRQLVILTRSVPYFQNTAAPAASGAEVSITDGSGRRTPLLESTVQPGHYVTNDLVAAVGMRYTLRIRWQGEDYEAVDSLVAVPSIDSLYFATRSDGGIGPGSGSATNTLRATIDYRDPAGIVNYYLWDVFVDGKRVDPSDTTARFRAIDTDQFYDGRPVRSMQPYADTPVKSAQQVMVRQQSITAQHYRYYKALNDQLESDGSPFAVPANSVRGNVANLTRPTARAMGYFITTNVSEKVLRVP